MILPLFKSHYSIGKSILTLANQSPEQGAADSIIELCASNSLEEVFLVEDSLVGFLEARKATEEKGLKLRFGLRISMTDSLQDKESSCVHKIVIFAKNSEGCKRLNKIYSFAFTKGNCAIDQKHLEKYWSDDDLKLVVPFYDSFVFENLLKFSSCIPDFSFTTPTYFIEDNNLPFDKILESKVAEYCPSPVKTKSIYYKNRKDFEAFQTYKCLCARQFYKKATLENPNLDHCSSTEFSMESWLEKNER